MSYAERIRQASSPPAALLVLAEGLDAILTHLDVAPASDPWAGWNVDTGAQPTSPTASAETTNGPVSARPVVDNSAAIAAAQEALNKASDPDDRRSLEARLRLLKDTGQAINIEPPAGVLATEQQVGDQIVLTLPPPSPERQIAREQFAAKNELWNFSTLDPVKFTVAFQKGGPLWLYHTARDEVMAMPYEWRQWLVEDINLDSPRTAQEVGRDILKDEGTGNKEVALGSLGVGDD